MSSKGTRCFSGSTHAAISGPLSQTFGHLEWGATQQFVIPMDAYQKDDQVVVNFGLRGRAPQIHRPRRRENVPDCHRRPLPEGGCNPPRVIRGISVYLRGATAGNDAMPPRPGRRRRRSQARPAKPACSAKFAVRLRLLCRDATRARTRPANLVDRIQRNPAVEVMLHTEVRELIGDDVLERIVIEDNQTGRRETTDARPLFVFIGAEPHTGWLEDQFRLDDHGLVITGSRRRWSRQLGHVGDKPALVFPRNQLAGDLRRRGTRAGTGDKKGGRRRRGSNGRPSGARVFEQYGRRRRGAGSIPPIDKGVLDGYHLPTFVLYTARHPARLRL